MDGLIRLWAGLELSGQIFLAALLAFGVVGFVLFNRALLRATRARVQRLDRRLFVALPKRSPLADANQQAKSKALDLVDAQARVVRRVALAILFFLAGLAAMTPFIGGTGASLVIGAMTVVVGIAARPVVGNAIAGAVLAYSRTLNVGDTVKIGEHYGTVEEFSFTHTTIRVWDWRRYVIPNNQMMDREFLNYSLFDRYQWAYVEFTVSYEADLRAVQAMAVASPLASEYFAPYEEPNFWVMALEPNGVRCWVAAWADTPSDAWRLTHDMRVELTDRMRAAGITPHVHHVDVRQSLNRTSDGTSPGPAG